MKKKKKKPALMKNVLKTKQRNLEFNTELRHYNECI